LDDVTPRGTVSVTAIKADGTETGFDAPVRIDTAGELTYWRSGGILNTVLRNLRD
jgi:aconitate hydratase